MKETTYTTAVSRLFDSSNHALISGLQNVNHNNSSILYVCNMGMRKILYISDSVYAILGYLPQQFIEGGIDFLAKRIHCKDYPRILRNYLEINNQLINADPQEKRPFSGNSEFRIEHNNGRWCEIKNDFIVLDYNKNGTIGKVLGIIQPVDKSLKFRHGNEIIFQRNSLKSSINPLKKFKSIFNGSEPVSKREKEVLHLVAKGYSSRTIANELHISTHTVTSHRKNLINKFQVKNTADLIRVASKCYWL